MGIVERLHKKLDIEEANQYDSMMKDLRIGSHTVVSKAVRYAEKHPESKEEIYGIIEDIIKRDVGIINKNKNMSSYYKPARNLISDTEKAAKLLAKKHPEYNKLLLEVYKSQITLCDRSLGTVKEFVDKYNREEEKYGLSMSMPAHPEDLPEDDRMRLIGAFDLPVSAFEYTQNWKWKKEKAEKKMAKLENDSKTEKFEEVRKEMDETFRPDKSYVRKDKKTWNKIKRDRLEREAEEKTKGEAK